MPKCPKCGTEMKRTVQMIRMPEIYLKCPECGAVVDETPDEYFGRAPEPYWVFPPST